MQSKRRTIGAAAILMAAVCAFIPQSAAAYLAISFISIPGIPGGWRAAPHKAWIRTEGYYWKGLDIAVSPVRSEPLSREESFSRRAFFSGPTGPQLADELVIAVSKSDRSVKRLMSRCFDKSPLPDVVFAEFSEMVRSGPEVGERPATMPAFFEYKLKNAQVSECPVVKGASEQAFVLKFSEIEWLYKGPTAGVPLTLRPASLPRPAQAGRTKTFVMSWFGNATAGEKSQCATMNDKASVQDYMTYLSGADADKARALLSANGGALNYGRTGKGWPSRRGPGFLNVCQIPGIVPSPVFHLPRTRVVPGLDLDGDGGARLSRPDVPYFRNYTSPDGRKGIDNQMFAATGCMPGMQGRNGFLDQYANEEMRNGYVSPLVTISGIDDDRNDDAVTITIAYSKDPMAKHASGRDILPDFTFTLTDDTQFSHYFQTLRGRIVHGVIETDPVELLQINRIYSSLNQIRKARLRLEIASDGSLKGLIGGYIAWRDYMAGTGNSTQEQLVGFQCPGLYHALKNAADGLKNPETGEYEGISTAYEIEGRPAYIAFPEGVPISAWMPAREREAISLLRKPT